MTNRLSLAATPPRALCALSAIVLLWSLFETSEAVSQTISVPLSFGQEIFENLLTSYTRTYTAVPQENAKISFTYTANPQQQLAPSLVTSCASATFTVLFDPTVSPSNITFSSIAITGLAALPPGATQQLQAVHINGPCPTSAPCDAPVVYFICGNSGNACPSGTNPTIPSFTVNTAQTATTADGSLLLGLLQGILSGNNLYYVNFHTAA
jgi:hypothetical protein